MKTWFSSYLLPEEDAKEQTKIFYISYGKFQLESFVSSGGTKVNDYYVLTTDKKSGTKAQRHHKIKVSIKCL